MSDLYICVSQYLLSSFTPHQADTRRIKSTQKKNLKSPMAPYFTCTTCTTCNLAHRPTQPASTFFSLLLLGIRIISGCLNLPFGILLFSDDDKGEKTRKHLQTLSVPRMDPSKKMIFKPQEWSPHLTKSLSAA